MKNILTATITTMTISISGLMAALPATELLKIEVTDASAQYGGRGVLSKDRNDGRATFKMTYGGELVTDAIFDDITTTNNMSIKGFDTTKSDEGIYTLYVSYKKKLQSCHLKILRPKENIDFYVTTQNYNGRKNFRIEMPNCFDDINSTDKKPKDTNHFESKHPYANNLNIEKTIYSNKTFSSKVLPPVNSILRIKGEIEANYDSITIRSVDGRELGTYDGLIDEEFAIPDGERGVKIKFKSDDMVSKSGVIITIDEKI